MNSLNHYAYGSVARWFYEGILGINATQPGFTDITIAPQFDKRLGRASGFYDTPEGKIAVSWEYQGDNIHVSITVPKNTVASFVVPDNKTQLSKRETENLQVGEHNFTLKTKI